MFFNLLFLVLGLLFGSFFSVVSYRLIKNLSWVNGRSMCPHCKKQINWYDNIPLLSFILLRGKCRNCKKKISFRYPAIEIVSAVGFCYLYTVFSANLITLFYSLLVFSLLFIILIIDFEHMIIPDVLVFIGIFITFIFYLFFNTSLIFPGLFAGLTASTLLLAISLITGGRGMGLGDVKFAVWGGMLVGLRLNLIWLFLAFLTGGVTGIILIMARRAGLKDQIAFGPFLIISIGLAIVFGKTLTAYLGF